MASRQLTRRTLLAVAGPSGVEARLAACGRSTGAQAGVTSTSTVDAVPLTGASGGAASAAGPTSAATTSGQTVAPTGAPVHVRLYQSDGQTYRVGMPIIINLSQKITRRQQFTKATTVTVDGATAVGAWYFQKSAIYADFQLEAHYRLDNYWPAHAAIFVDLPIQGLSTGTNLIFDDSLTLEMNTGAKSVTTVDGATERPRLISDGTQKFDFPVSLGKASTPTITGTKVLMELEGWKHRAAKYVKRVYQPQRRRRAAVLQLREDR